MPRARDPNRDKAFEIWKSKNGDITNRALAEMLDVPEKTISAWKSRDEWNAVLQKDECSTTNKPKPKKKKSVPKLEPPVESDELTDRQRLFCLYYVKSFNATNAAINAGYAPDSAHVEGSRLLRNAKVAKEIRAIKDSMRQGLFIDAMDVLDKYIKIAFADATDYATFGRREVPVMGAFGPLVDEKGQQITREENFVDFNSSDVVDGTIITEIKQGKDGIAVKLADKMKALDKLSLYFDLFPDKFKRQVEEEKLRIAHHKVFGSEDPDEYEDDGFEDALNATTSEVWGDDHSTEEDS
ncbi:terminase [Jeotgalibacillus alimentarius]|uniref:Terminase n=1 Tax=Jeotgalibacillus alimentarius TaxID=135826 RepID=A0A0C2R9D9_9BACL|nr:terminase small subunit [Jeotgalibacillus alimentarius]KIL46945.1 terminase [Jeotgalibacillus alimentarius]